MTRRPRAEPLPARETDLEPPVRRYLEGRGYRVYFDPDGQSFFDAVARHGEEVGLVELKLTDWKTLRRQGFVRRTFGDWSAVLLPRIAAAERLQAQAQAGLSRSIGVWYLEGGEVRVLRAAQTWSEATRTRFAPARAALLTLLDARDSGLVPPGVAWDGFGSARIVGERRSLREGRLDEFDEDG